MKEKTQQEDLLPGTLDLLILKSVTRRPMHGYDIVESIQQASDDVFRVEEGALINHCIVWNCADCSILNGDFQKTTDARNSID